MIRGTVQLGQTILNRRTDSGCRHVTHDTHSAKSSPFKSGTRETDKAVKQKQ